MKRVALSLCLGLLFASSCGSDDSGGVGGGDSTDSDKGKSSDDTSSDDSDKVTGSVDAGIKKDSGGGVKKDSGPPSTGKKDSGSGGDPTLCDSHIVTAHAIIPDVLIVLDASLSMTTGGRWLPSVMAVQSLTTQYESQVAFGLELFPPGGLPSCNAGVLDVPPAQNSASKINMIVGATAAAGLTPTAPALTSALMFLGDRTDQAADQSVAVTPANVLLVTDGQPDCGSADPGGDAVRAVTALSAANIKTYVVGYQIDALGQGLMNQMAMAGQTDHFYSVESGSDLQDAFKIILGNLVSCEFDLDELPDDPTYVRVTIDGETKVLDSADGWVLDGKKVTLQGGSCDNLKDGAPHAVNVGVECKPVVVM